MPIDQQPRWPSTVLKLAAIYNLLWGAWVIAFPNHLFQLTGIASPNYPGIWQCVGMIVGVYGIGYWFAARDFRIHWPVVLVGFLGKIFGPIGFVQSAISGALPWSWGLTIVTNDLVWWWPFGAMLYLAFKYHNDPRVRFASQAESEIPQPRVSSGLSIEELLNQGTKLLVFVRHNGCTFCHETVKSLADQSEEWIRRGIEPVVVHMGSLESGRHLLADAGLAHGLHISDPGCELYRQYGLQRGSLWQLFGPKVWIRGFRSAILKRNRLGKLQGDGFQLGGAVLIEKGNVRQVFPATSAAMSLPSISECKV
jgi:peroxiredoxin